MYSHPGLPVPDKTTGKLLYTISCDCRQDALHSLNGYRDRHRNAKQRIRSKRHGFFQINCDLTNTSKPFNLAMLSHFNQARAVAVIAATAGLEIRRSVEIA